MNTQVLLRTAVWGISAIVAVWLAMSSMRANALAWVIYGVVFVMASVAVSGRNRS